MLSRVPLKTEVNIDSTTVVDNQIIRCDSHNPTGPGIAWHWESGAPAQVVNPPVNNENSVELFQEQGDNLMLNGSGWMGDATNLPGMTFNATEGAFTRQGDAIDILSQEYMKVNRNVPYMQALRAKTDDDGNMYIGLQPYDANKDQIESHMYMYKAGTITTLTQEFDSAVDTVMHVADSSAWAQEASNYDNGLALSPANGYIDRAVFEANPAGYTRHAKTGPQISASPAIASVSAGQVVFAAPPDIAQIGGSKVWPIGTYVRQAQAGGVAIYSAAVNVQLQQNYAYYEGIIGHAEYDGVALSYQFWPGTSYVRWLAKINRAQQSSTTTHSLRDLYFGKV